MNFVTERSHSSVVDHFHIAHAIDNPRYRSYEQEERKIFEGIERRLWRDRGVARLQRIIDSDYELLIPEDYPETLRFDGTSLWQFLTAFHRATLKRLQLEAKDSVRIANKLNIVDPRIPRLLAYNREYFNAIRISDGSKPMLLSHNLIVGQEDSLSVYSSDFFNHQHSNVVYFHNHPDVGIFSIVDIRSMYDSDLGAEFITTPKGVLMVANTPISRTLYSMQSSGWYAEHPPIDWLTDNQRIIIKFQRVLSILEDHGLFTKKLIANEDNPRLLDLPNGERLNYEGEMLLGWFYTFAIHKRLKSIAYFSSYQDGGVFRKVNRLSDVVGEKLSRVFPDGLDEESIMQQMMNVIRVR